jgi:Fe-S-cluster containining protein
VRYERWLDALVGEDLPRERRATCDDCVMCGARAESGGVAPELRFDAEVKCCSFYPRLPNYLVGAILGDPTTDARFGLGVVRRRIRGREAATPLGLFVSPSEARRYDRMRGAGAFGRTREVRCPFLTDETRCGIWQNRNGVCATYFCRHDDRAQGHRLWESVLALLNRIERALSRWCVIELADPHALDELFDAEGEGRRIERFELHGEVSDEGVLAPSLAARLWGRWLGREEEFYRACAAKVDALDAESVRAIGGVEVLLGARRAREASRARERRSLPLVLCHKVTHTVAAEGGVALYGSRAPYDPLVVSEDVAEALDALQSEHGVTLDEATLAALRAHDALTEPDGRDTPPALQREGPLDPNETLRVFRDYDSQPVSLTDGVSDEGAAALVVRCGMKEVVFDDPALVTFARNLVERQNGFRAGDASMWGVGGALLPWDKVAELLGALVEARVLQRGARALTTPT